MDKTSYISRTHKYRKTEPWHSRSPFANACPYEPRPATQCKHVRERCPPDAAERKEEVELRCIDGPIAFDLCHAPPPPLPQAVNEEWIKGGHRRRAVRVLSLFLVYMGVFTLSAVLNSGRNQPHGFHLTTYDIERDQSVVATPVPSPYSNSCLNATTRILCPTGHHISRCYLFPPLDRRGKHLCSSSWSGGEEEGNEGGEGGCPV